MLNILNVQQQWVMDVWWEWLAPQLHSLHFANVQLCFCEIFCIDYNITICADLMVRRYNLKGLEDLETFSTLFRKQRHIGWAKYILCRNGALCLFRLTLGLTQEQVGLAVGEYCGTYFSQTTISRFESLNLSYRNMIKLANIFSGWLQVASLRSIFWLFKLFGPDYDSREKEETNRKRLQELNVVNFKISHELLCI